MPPHESLPDDTANPGVSVVMPVRNEARHLAESLGSVLHQDYPGDLEVIIALGGSTDASRQVAQRLVAREPRARIVDNPTGRTPQALNAAIAATRYPIVARVDAHGALPRDYLTTAVAILLRTGAANVGGRAVPRGVSKTQRAIAVGMGSRLGMGGARFRVGGQAGPAETVFPGVFRREWLHRVGGFSEEYERAQDWEMNLRIRQAGGLVWFSPEVCVTYRPRGSFRGLAAQFFSTGQWRRRLAAEHRGALSARYLAPPVVVVAVAGGALGALWWPPLALLPAGYALAVTAGGLTLARHEPWPVRRKVPMVLATMHLSWGAGFLVGVRPEPH